MNFQYAFDNVLHPDPDNGFQAIKSLRVNTRLREHRYGGTPNNKVTVENGMKIMIRQIRDCLHIRWGGLWKGRQSETYSELVEEMRSLRGDYEMLTGMVGKLARKLGSKDNDEEDDEDEEDMLPLIIDELDKIKFVSLLLEDEGAFKEFLIRNIVPEDDWLRAFIYDEFDIGENRMVVPSAIMQRRGLFN